jgi:3-isopropylmalate/(R)-2-methylmalate dehydratase small subunit
MKYAGKAHTLGANIDTDAIIPAKFLVTIDPMELGANCMSGMTPGWVNRVEQGDIIVAGENFGCGSSREHAPWALTANGFTAVISTSFADIFRNNALKNGLLPVVVDDEMHQLLFDLIEEVPSAELTIDLATQTLTLPTGQTATFPIDGFSKACLLQGTDELGYLLSFDAQIAAHEARLPSLA